MADVQFENFAPNSTTHAFSAIWKWTRAMKKAGWIYKSSSDGTTKETTGVATADKWGGSADPASDTYPAFDAAAAWWNAQGPTTLKLSMTTAPTGVFFRGEKVTQAVSGAEGELVGYDFDSVGAQGHAVIIPRTGTFDNNHVITGFVSGATFTPTALLTFVCEIVIFKNSATVTSGSIYVQRVINETENAQRFSVLATQSSCTGSVAPGGGTDASNNWFPSPGSTTIAAGSNGLTLPQSTINVASTQNAASYPTFPTAGTITVTTSGGPQVVSYTGTTGTTFTGCTGGSGTMTTGGAVVANTTFGTHSSCGTQVNGTITHRAWLAVSSNLGKAQIVAANNTGSAGVSPDGTTFIVIGDTSSATQAQMIGYFRCDDSEEGDVDPFVFYSPTTSNWDSTNARKSNAVGSNLSFQNLCPNIGAGTSANWRGTRRRGWATGDNFATFSGSVLYNSGSNSVVLANNNAVQETVACSYTTKIVRERIYLIASDTGNKMRKGSLRWIHAIQGNSLLDTYDTKTRAVIIPFTSGVPSVIIGPLDGVTPPSQS